MTVPAPSIDLSGGHHGFLFLEADNTIQACPNRPQPLQAGGRGILGGHVARGDGPG
jgi:hypothetical protein